MRRSVIPALYVTRAGAAGDDVVLRIFPVPDFPATRVLDNIRWGRGTQVGTAQPRDRTIHDRQGYGGVADKRAPIEKRACKS